MQIKCLSRLLIFVGFFFVIAASGTSVLPQTQQASMAQLMVTGKSSGGVKPSITLNNTNLIDGSNLTFPAQITVPADTMATVSFGSDGKLDFASGTVVNISYTESGISVDLTEGRLMITSAPNSNFSIKTVDGLITNDKSRNAIFVTEIIGGSTGVNTETGIALVNGVPVRAGEVWTADPSKKAAITKASKFKNGSRRSKLWLVGLGAAAGAGIAAIIIAAAND